MTAVTDIFTCTDEELKGWKLRGFECLIHIFFFFFFLSEFFQTILYSRKCIALRVFKLEYTAPTDTLQITAFLTGYIRI